MVPRGELRLVVKGSVSTVFVCQMFFSYLNYLLLELLYTMKFMSQAHLHYFVFQFAFAYVLFLC